MDPLGWQFQVRTVLWEVEGLEFEVRGLRAEWQPQVPFEEKERGVSTSRDELGPCEVAPREEPRERDRAPMRGWGGPGLCEAESQP